MHKIENQQNKMKILQQSNSKFRRTIVFMMKDSIKEFLIIRLNPQSVKEVHLLILVHCKKDYLILLLTNQVMNSHMN
jgi:hypothetical protein